jgi:radical SAM superfamily enzyme YgiQ (UPF0313 family)
MVGLGMAPPRVLLILPPLTQLNTPYPSTAYLTGFLQSRGYAVEDSAPDESTEKAFVAQADVGIEMVLALFSRSGLGRVFDSIRCTADLPGVAMQMLALERAYLDTVEPVIAFLQGRDPALAPLICQGGFLPQGPRFASIPVTEPRVSSTDLAKHLATLYLEDLADLIQQTVSPHFALSRYAEHMGTSASSFDTIAVALNRPVPLTDELMLDAAGRHMARIHPTVVGLTVPFPGNLYGALRIAQSIKAHSPGIAVVLGGGYANTELRRVNDPRVFDLVDYIMLDDGERPLLCVLEHLSGKRDELELKRTFVRRDGKVMYRNGALEPDFGMAELGTPTYVGLPLPCYLSILDTLNPMHRLWSEGHWNKLTVAHGCYWKQCTFCDVGLDYIGRYETSPTELLADRIEALIGETGRRGFHFVDEAAPPASLKALALTLLERGVAISWWGNIRFEEAFDMDLCRLLAASGCIAVSAGLEVASDRLLAAMKKGITVDQTVRVAAAFRSAGILIHAYLMYGFPGETIAETVESLERVRQLFAHDLLQSAFWHRFVATAHSPVGLDPAAHGVLLVRPNFGGFAENDLEHVDPLGEAPAWLGEGLKKALFSYKEGDGLRTDVRQWFDRPVSRPKVPRDWAARIVAITDHSVSRANPESCSDRQSRWERRLIWTGGHPVMEGNGASRRVILPNRTEDVVLRLSADKAGWLVDLL